MFTYLGRNVSSTESHLNIYQAKARIDIDRLSIILKYDLSEKIKQDFFQALSILLNGCTTWTLTKRIEKRLDGENKTCYELSWTNRGSNTPRNNRSTSIYVSSLKPSKQDGQDMWDTAGEAKKKQLISDVLLWTPTRPLSSHLKNNPSKMKKIFETMLVKQGETHKWRSSMDPYAWTCQCWPISKDLFTIKLYEHRMMFGRPYGSDGW